MASDLSKYMGNKICRWLAGEVMPAVPAGVFVALFNGDPKAAGTEVTTTIATGGRIEMPCVAPAANDTDNVLASSGDVNFGDAVGAATMSWLGFFDAQVGGNRLGSKAIPGGAIAVEVGTGVSFLAGDITFTIGT